MKRLVLVGLLRFLALGGWAAWLAKASLSALVSRVTACVWGLTLPAGFASGNGRIEATEYDVATKPAGRLATVLVREGPPCWIPARPCASSFSDRYPDGRYSVAGAAKRFGARLEVVRAWIKRGPVTGERHDFQVHRQVWRLEIAEDAVARLEHLAAALRRS